MSTLESKAWFRFAKVVHIFIYVIGFIIIGISIRDAADTSESVKEWLPWSIAGLIGWWLMEKIVALSFLYIFGGKDVAANHLSKLLERFKE